MTKIRFKLSQSPEKTEIDKIVDCQKNGELTIFQIDNICYEYQSKKQQLKFVRYSDEFVFTIDIKNDINSITYKLIDQNLEFDIPYDYLYFEENDPTIKIFYKIKTQPEEYVIEIKKEE